jgi:hypothetical protein
MLRQQSLLLAIGTSKADLMDKPNSARQRAEDLLADMQPLAGKSRKTADEKREVESKLVAYRSYVYEYLNMLQIGCDRYLAGKGDKDAFKKTYHNDVRMFVDTCPAVVSPAIPASSTAATATRPATHRYYGSDVGASASRGPQVGPGARRTARPAGWRATRPAGAPGLPPPQPQLPPV